MIGSLFRIHNTTRQFTDCECETQWHFHFQKHTRVKLSNEIQKKTNVASISLEFHGSVSSCCSRKIKFLLLLKTVYLDFVWRFVYTKYARLRFCFHCLIEYFGVPLEISFQYFVGKDKFGWHWTNDFCSSRCKMTKSFRCLSTYLEIVS